MPTILYLIAGPFFVGALYSQLFNITQFKGDKKMAKVLSYAIKTMAMEKRISIDTEIASMVNSLKSATINADTYMDKIALKARNDFIHSHSLAKANDVVIALKEAKLPKFLATFKAKFACFCGLYAAKEISEKGNIAYIYDSDSCPMVYDKKEQAFYLESDVNWQELKPVDGNFSNMKVKRIKKENGNKEIPVDILVQYLLARSDLQEILDAIASQQEKGKKKDKTKANKQVDKLADAIA